ncbi:tRNA(His) guanylyltransferase [Malassezia brasiliensis]|uniref:tRNA(His) guanylyltransferase n=1 Tax=Malassezia brasiliensis TaxID=1821822 RepID=A0AAF0DVY6_9BASI|nr:tRNA(His) guanylyltransferase [Malassezia brasiliensis]
MAGSRYAYVRDFELGDAALPHTYLVVRIDGRGFHRFSHAHGFAKPNDAPALELMNEAARAVLREFKGHITLAFGESDEYSFLIDRASTLYSRRQSKLVSHIVSIFTGAYVFHWASYMHVPLQAPPSFDGRLVMYPGVQEVRDYFAWRQADTHINNLYNTTFWALVLQGGQTEREAHETLKGTYSKDKHEILFSRFGINYDKIPALFRKGTTLVYAPVATPGRPAKAKTKTELRTLHIDLIQDAFWCAAPDAAPGEAKGIEAPAAGSAIASAADGSTDTPDTPFYADPRRLQCAGLGALVLSDRT